METKNNNYRQFKWGGHYQSPQLLICVLWAQIPYTLGIVESWQVWGQGVLQQFLMDKNPSQILKSLGICFLGLGWRWVLVWFIWFCCCSCLYTWVGFVWFFSLFTPPGFPGSLSSHLAQYRNRKALLHLVLQLARTSCIQDLKHLYSCWTAHMNYFYKS